MVTPPPRLVVGTYDSSNASDSEFSDFETSRDKGDQGPKSPGCRRRVRRMPVSYLGSKFLGSDLESEEDEELVEAFLRRGDKKPSAPPPRRRVALPVPVFDNSPEPQLSKADRWREYVSQVSWGNLKHRVKCWAPRSSPGVGEAQQASARVEREGAAALGSAHHVGSAGDGRVPGTPPRRWRPKMNWASFRRRRREAAASTAQVAEAAEDQRAEAADNQRAEAAANQRAGAIGVQRAEAPAVQRAEVADNQRAGAPALQGAQAASNGAEAIADQRAEAPAIQEAEASAARGATGATSGARTRKQVKTVRFQTPGRFSWFRKHRRAFWHTPRLPALPKRVPRAGEARHLRVLRAEARAEAEQGEQKDHL
ncbi:hypothetical protein HPG69_018256 [Diceros bicornis minor]|uniref:Coiled-coil domain-containing protein 8 n=1 Tax=Diceros bicornis minor TaxID=77932 RepID=A0A7J7E3T4_DICBM|nr:hypothetical protein HPG69_018256 [Diceros bicornis minor]